MNAFGRKNGLGGSRPAFGVAKPMHVVTPHSGGAAVSAPEVAEPAAFDPPPAALAEELERVRQTGMAVDNGEITESLYCIAAPIRMADGRVPAAISISRTMAQIDPAYEAEVQKLLLSAARTIERQMPVV